MTNYISVPAEDIPVGRTALVLFIDRDQLCAGVIEHSPDGSLDRRIPDNPSPFDIVLVICTLMAQSSGDDLYVVLEQNAYWPEAFPALRSHHESEKRKVGVKL